MPFGYGMHPSMHGMQNMPAGMMMVPQPAQPAGMMMPPQPPAQHRRPTACDSGDMPSSSGESEESGACLLVSTE